MHTTLTRLAAGAATALSMAMPMAATAQTVDMADSLGLRNQAWSMDRVIQTFTKPGGTTSEAYENDTVAESGFDFSAFISHPCYQPVGDMLKESCDLRFGTYGNLMAALEDETFRAALAAEFGADILPLFTAVKTEAAMTAATEESNFDSLDAYAATHSRRSQLWEECGQVAGESQAACYQDNIRLLDDEILPIDGNVYYRGMNRMDTDLGSAGLDTETTGNWYSNGTSRDMNNSDGRFDNGTGDGTMNNANANGPSDNATENSNSRNGVGDGTENNDNGSTGTRY